MMRETLDTRVGFATVHALELTHAEDAAYLLSRGLVKEAQESIQRSNECRLYRITNGDYSGAPR